MEITELDEVNEFQLDSTQHFELIRVVASTRLDLAATLPTSCETSNTCSLNTPPFYSFVPSPLPFLKHLFLFFLLNQ